MADLDQRLEKVKFRLKGVSLVARFAMVAAASSAYIIMESSGDEGVWLREGTGSKHTSATCFIFDADGFQQKFASVEVEMVSVSVTEVHSVNLTFLGSELEKNCGYMSNYTVSKPGPVNELLEDSWLAEEFSSTIVRVAMVLVLQALHFARDALATKCGAQQKPKTEHQEVEDGQQEKTGCCPMLKKKLSWLFTDTSFFTQMCVIVLPYILLKPLSSIGQSNGVVYIRWPAMYSIVAVGSSLVVPIGVYCLAVLYLHGMFCQKWLGCCAHCSSFFYVYFVAPLMVVFICASFYIFVADGFLFFINFSLVFSFTLKAQCVGNPWKSIRHRHFLDVLVHAQVAFVLLPLALALDHFEETLHLRALPKTVDAPDLYLARWEFQIVANLTKSFKADQFDLFPSPIGKLLNA
eukprot:symbB.v1.2.005316.t1/scaffold283.1/size308953/17